MHLDCEDLQNWNKTGFKDNSEKKGKRNVVSNNYCTLYLNTVFKHVLNGALGNVRILKKSQEMLEPVNFQVFNSSRFWIFFPYHLVTNYKRTNHIIQCGWNQDLTEFIKSMLWFHFFRLMAMVMSITLRKILVKLVWKIPNQGQVQHVMHL